MIRFNTTLTAIVCLFTFQLSFGQQKVESDDYADMLQDLLSHTVNEISVDSAAVLDSVIYLDSRERNEYEASHIKGAIWVGYDTFNLDSLKDISPNSKIIVYCSVGYRSEVVSNKMIKAGYKDVSNLYGGIFEWVNREMPVYNDSGQTPQVHAYDKNWGVWVTKGEKIYND